MVGTQQLTGLASDERVESEIAIHFGRRGEYARWLRSVCGYLLFGWRMDALSIGRHHIARYFGHSGLSDPPDVRISFIHTFHSCANSLSAGLRRAPTRWLGFVVAVS